MLFDCHFVPSVTNLLATFICKIGGTYHARKGPYFTHQGIA